MKKFAKFNIEPKIISSNENICTVVFSPLEQGFGTTIGNSLRRVLLSSIPAPAVFAIKVNGISHEFTPIPGVLEDATTIVLNVKKLALKVDLELFDFESLLEQPFEQWPTLKISKNKKGIVTAGDIVTFPGLTVVNKNLKICELTEDIDFQAEFYVAYDRGYRNYTENRDALNTLKIVAIDSLFSPILKVEWNVVEEKTTKYGTTDKLTLTVATNGSIKALDALSYASNILLTLLKPIAEFNPKLSNVNLINPSNVHVRKSVSATPIDTLGLTMRSFNCLKSNGINTIPELVSISKQDAENIKNLGRKSLCEIIDKLAEQNLSFKDS